MTTTFADPPLERDCLDAPADAALPLGGVASTPLRERAHAFFFAWSLYLLLHHSMVYYAWFRFTDSRGQRDLTGLLIGSAVWLLGATALFRRTVPWFMALLIGQLTYELPALPKTANHTFLTICINITMLATIGWHAIRTRGRALGDAEPFFPQLAALLRLEILAMYFFVVLHKLNADYFNPSYSCATTLYGQIVDDYPFFPSGAWTDPLCIYGALGSEAAIPLLLLFRATRLWGVGLGLLFHFLLAPHANPFIFSFSALLYAAYVLFLPMDVLGEMVATWAKLLRGLRRRWLFFAIVVGGAALTIVALRLFARPFVERTDLINHAHPLTAACVRLAWNLLALFNIYAFALALCTRHGKGDIQNSPRAASGAGANLSEDSGCPFFRPAFTTPLLVFPLLVVFNGFCPYLGLKTESAFAMYANLRTEGARNNHLFMPRINLGSYQNDLVEIIDSSDHRLRALRREGYGLTWFEFRRNKLSRLSHNPKRDEFWVTFKRNGVEQTLRYAAQQAHPAFGPVPWYERRLLYFRDVQVEPASPQHCGH